MENDFVGKGYIPIEEYRERIPERVYREVVKKYRFITPVQAEAIDKGLFSKDLLVVAPTGSGKTLIAEMLFLDNYEKGKCIYVVPLRSLAKEKFNDFKDWPFSVALSTGDYDSSDDYLEMYDVIIVTAEKLDSLIRHKPSWIREVSAVVIDEVHMINDVKRGPVLEFVIVLLKEMVNARFVYLSATIGNPETLADWLKAGLIVSDWRPTTISHATLVGNELRIWRRDKNLLSHKEGMND